MAQTLLGLRELLQTVQPEVEVLRGHSGPKTLVQLTGKLVAALKSDGQWVKEQEIQTDSTYLGLHSSLMDVLNALGFLSTADHDYDFSFFHQGLGYLYYFNSVYKSTKMFIMYSRLCLLSFISFFFYPPFLFK